MLLGQWVTFNYFFLNMSNTPKYIPKYTVVGKFRYFKD